MKLRTNSLCLKKENFENVIFSALTLWRNGRPLYCTYFSHCSVELCLWKPRTSTCWGLVQCRYRLPHFLIHRCFLSMEFYWSSKAKTLTYVLATSRSTTRSWTVDMYAPACQTFCAFELKFREKWRVCFLWVLLMVICVRYSLPATRKSRFFS
jgi:hypothetical protein